MDYSNRQTIQQGRQNQIEANETPASFTMENGVVRSEDTGDLAFKARSNRMAGQAGARALELMNDPNELNRTQAWMNAFGQSNQGAEWNIAKMNGGMAQVL